MLNSTVSPPASSASNKSSIVLTGRPLPPRSDPLAPGLVDTAAGARDQCAQRHERTWLTGSNRG
jgi:hypothetical protein